MLTVLSWVFLVSEFLSLPLHFSVSSWFTRLVSLVKGPTVNEWNVFPHTHARTYWLKKVLLLITVTVSLLIFSRTYNQRPSDAVVLKTNQKGPLYFSEASSRGQNLVGGADLLDAVIQGPRSYLLGRDQCWVSMVQDDGKSHGGTGGPCFNLERTQTTSMVHWEFSHVAKPDSYQLGSPGPRGLFFFFLTTEATHWASKLLQNKEWVWVDN